MRMELAGCLTLRCLSLDINTPSPQHTDRGVHDAVGADGVGDVLDVGGVEVLGACCWILIPLPPNTLTVVFMMPMPCVCMELAMCLTLRCLLLDINTPPPQRTDRGVHDADAVCVYGVGGVSDVEVFVAGY